MVAVACHAHFKVTFDVKQAHDLRHPLSSQVCCGALLCSRSGRGDMRCCAHFHPDDRFLVPGLTLKHTRGHLFRGLIESIAFGTETILETLRSNGYLPDGMTLAGGASKSALWLKIHADVSQLPLHLTQVKVCLFCIRPRRAIFSSTALSSLAWRCRLAFIF